jgi:hypothetical protein
MAHLFSRYRGRMVRGGVGLLAVLILVAGGWGIWRWVTYPEAPDIATAELETSIAFVASDDFNRMFERHRRRFIEAMIARLGEESFPELLALVMQQDENRRDLMRNLRRIEGHEDLAARFYGMFLDRFYDQPKTIRDAYLSMLIVAQQQGLGERTRELGLPSEDDLKRSMTEFVTRQPPRVQAQTTQFLLDLRRQREALGYPDPWSGGRPAR